MPPGDLETGRKRQAWDKRARARKDTGLRFRVGGRYARQTSAGDYQRLAQRMQSQAVRVPGSNVTLALRIRAGSGALKTHRAGEIFGLRGDRWLRTVTSLRAHNRQPPKGKTDRAKCVRPFAMLYISSMGADASRNCNNIASTRTA